MPELAATAEIEEPPPLSAEASIDGRLSVTGEATFIPQRSFSDWYSATVPPQPPVQNVGTMEHPPLPGEVSRTTILTQAGISMTVIVANVDHHDFRRDTGWIGQGCIRFHVMTNGITPALHLQNMVSRELGNDYPNIYQEVVNSMVHQVQERVLAERQRVVEAVRERAIATAEEQMRRVYAVPAVQYAPTITFANTNNLYVNANFFTAGTGGYLYGWRAINNTTYAGIWDIQTQPLSEEEQTKLKAKLAAEDKLVAEANNRAEQLLLDLLGEMGFARYKRKGYVLVLSRTKPGTVYRVRGMAGIDLYERNKRGKIISLDKYLCIHPRDVYPEADTIAAQVMLCRHDEETLWKTANIHKRSGAGFGINLAAVNFAA